MAIEIKLKKDNIVKNGYVGFSWTTLFFGFFVPLFRGDWLWLLIMLILGIFTSGIANIVLAFLYNKIYTNKLLEDGWQPADDYSKSVLVTNNMIIG